MKHERKREHRISRTKKASSSFSGFFDHLAAPSPSRAAGDILSCFASLLEDPVEFYSVGESKPQLDPIREGTDEVTVESNIISCSNVA